MNFRNLSAERLVSLGSVASVAGKGSILSLVPANLAKPASQVIVIITRADGLGEQFICSANLSRALRSGEVKFGAILKCDVVETTNKFGKAVNTISFPFTEREPLIDHLIAKIKPAELPAPILTDRASIEQVIYY